MNSVTVFTSSHIFSSCSTASPIFPSLHVNFLENFSHPFALWHIYSGSTNHTTHNGVLAFTLNLQTPHGSTLLLGIPSFVIPPFTLVFPRLTFKPLLSKASFHFIELYLSASMVSLIKARSSACNNSLAFAAANLLLCSLQS